MKLEINADSGILKAWYTFNFDKDEMGPNYDGFYATFVLFFDCFHKVPTIDEASFFSNVSGTDNSKYMSSFVIQSGYFFPAFEPKIFAVLERMCDRIMTLDLANAVFEGGIDGDKMVRGLPFAKEYAKKLKDSINKKEIKVSYEYTDPFA